MEACAAGKPCVAANVGGIPEIIEDGKNGFLVPPFNYNIMSDRIIKTLEDKKLSDEMGEYGKRIVREKFNIVDKVRNLQKLYLQSSNMNL